MEKVQLQMKPLDVPKLPTAKSLTARIEDTVDRNAAKTMSKKELRTYERLKALRKSNAAKETAEASEQRSQSAKDAGGNRGQEWVNVPRPSTIMTIVMIAVAALYIYKTVKDDGIVVNAQTGAKRSVFRWADIALGTFASLYILRSVRTFF